MESPFEIVLSLAVSLALLIYMVYTLIRPDKFNIYEVTQK